MWWLIPIPVVLFLLVHLAKMGRLYLVLMEHKISLFRFVLLYCKTTFVNLVIPFKIGELYRIFSIKKETKVWQVGILSVFIDRFFDILALTLILLPIDLNYDKHITFITGLFVVLMVVIMVGYLCLLPTYTYLNQYIIMHKQSKRSMMTLKALECVKEWYDFSTRLIHGRFALITLFSFIGWIFEILLLGQFAEFLKYYFNRNEYFGIDTFSDYVASIFIGGGSSLMNTYTWGTAGIFLVASIILQLVFAFRKERA